MLTELVPTNWVFSRNTWCNTIPWGNGEVGSAWSWLKACWHMKATSLGSAHASVRLISFSGVTNILKQVPNLLVYAVIVLLQSARYMYQ